MKELEGRAGIITGGSSGIGLANGSYITGQDFAVDGGALAYGY